MPSPHRQCASAQVTNSETVASLTAFIVNIRSVAAQVNRRHLRLDLEEYLPEVFLVGAFCCRSSDLALHLF